MKRNLCNFIIVWLVSRISKLINLNYRKSHIAYLLEFNQNKKQYSSEKKNILTF